MAERPPLMRLTDAAAVRVRELLDQRGAESAGVRIGVRSAGCSGLAYSLEYVDEIEPFDEVVTDKGSMAGPTGR